MGGEWMGIAGGGVEERTGWELQGGGRREDWMGGRG